MPRRGGWKPHGAWSKGPRGGAGAQAAPELVAKGQKPQQGTAQSCWERRWEALSEENHSPTASASSPTLPRQLSLKQPAFAKGEIAHHRSQTSASRLTLQKPPCSCGTAVAKPNQHPGGSPSPRGRPAPAWAAAGAGGDRAAGGIGQPFAAASGLFWGSSALCSSTARTEPLLGPARSHAGLWVPPPRTHGRGRAPHGSAAGYRPLCHLCLRVPPCSPASTSPGGARGSLTNEAGFWFLQYFERLNDLRGKWQGEVYNHLPSPGTSALLGIRSISAVSSAYGSCGRVRRSLGTGAGF